jgi:glycosyltransferase involved in cell wall biosynthesis
LERLLRSFEQINCSFGDIVVSDDGSKPEHILVVKALAEELGFRLVTTQANAGLGNNINKGQDAVNTPYTLYVQEDFEPAADFVNHFSDALNLLEERKDIDIARFYAYSKYPYLLPLKNGFSEMLFGFFKPGYKKFYAYSDHPHLRRRNFFERFGRYTEGVKGDVTEYRMMLSFLQHKGKAIFYDDYNALFEQKNSSAEPSTMKRNFWRENNNYLVWFMRESYRYAKFNFDYLFRRF